MSAAVTIGNRYVYIGTSAERVALVQIPAVGILGYEQDTRLWFTYSHTTNTWVPYAEAASIYGAGPTGGPIGSDQGNLYVLPWLWQPSSLTYVRASADASGNLLVSTGLQPVSTARGVALAGVSTILTPPAGKSIQLLYYMLNAQKSNATSASATLDFGSGTPQLTNFDAAPTGTLARNIGAGDRDVTGAVNDTLVVTATGGDFKWALEFNFV